MAPSHKDKTKILFVAANPSDQLVIQTDTEHRTIKAEMERGRHRDFFEFLPAQFAVTITELLRAFNTGPNIIHFSGHGLHDGIVLTSDDNQSRLLPNDDLIKLFKPLRNTTRIVLLNSCYSATQAEVISKLGMYVVGYNLPVGDSAAVSFSKGFYIGLSEGKCFESAFNYAMIVLGTENKSYCKLVEVWKDGKKLENNEESNDTNGKKLSNGGGNLLSKWLIIGFSILLASVLLWLLTGKNDGNSKAHSRPNTVSLKYLSDSDENPLSMGTATTDFKKKRQQNETDSFSSKSNYQFSREKVFDKQKIAKLVKEARNATSTQEVHSKYQEAIKLLPQNDKIRFEKVDLIFHPTETLNKLFDSVFYKLGY